MRKISGFIAALFTAASLHAGTKLLEPTNAPHGTSLPATCSVGDIYQKTNATSGSQWYACESANNWVLQGGGASGNFINNQATLQSGATFYVSSGTVNTNLHVLGKFSVGTSSEAAPINVEYGANGSEMAVFYDTAGVNSFSRMSFYGKAFGGAKTKSGTIEWSGSTPYIKFLNYAGLGIELGTPMSGIAVTDNMFFYGSKGFSFFDADNSNYIGIAAPSTVFTSYQLTLPDLPGSDGQSLVTDGAGNLSFQTIASTYTNFVVSGVIGSSTGTFNFSGTTVTIPAPSIDTVNRILVLNNGLATWPAMADGASLSSTQTFSGANTFTSSVTVASADASRTALVIKGAAGQTANLTEWQNSGSAVLFRVTPSGTFRWGSAQEGTLTFDGTHAYIDSLNDLVLRPNNAAFQALRLSPTTQAALLKTPSAAVRGLTIRGFASQSANLQEWQNDSSVVGSSVSADGSTITASTFTANTAFVFPDGTRQTTAATGSGSKPPREFFFDASSMMKLETNFPSLEAISTTTIKSFVQRFDPTTREYVNFKFQLPADLNTAVASTATFRAVVKSTFSSTANIELDLEYACRTDNQAWEVGYSTTTGTAALNTGGDVIRSFTWTASVSTLTGWAANSECFGRLSRDPATSGDLSGDMDLFNFVIEAPRS